MQSEVCAGGKEFTELAGDNLRSKVRNFLKRVILAFTGPCRLRLRLPLFASRLCMTLDEISYLQQPDPYQICERHLLYETSSHFRLQRSLCCARTYQGSGGTDAGNTSTEVGKSCNKCSTFANTLPGLEVVWWRSEAKRTVVSTVVDLKSKSNRWSLLKFETLGG